MNDWHKIQDLFLAAADLPPDEQERFLDSACGRDAALRQEVQSLLASDRAGGEGIAAALQDAAQSLLGEDPMIGTRLGPWRLVREIGRGGMGAVYLAVRDEQFQQRAAVKVIRYGLDTDELLDRFRRERQILATLEHPCIARLIDGGSTGEGRPFLVMEYVEGQSVDAWRQERSPSVQDCCRLFLKVCGAVAHAHRSLVIHRDLKPGNILITADGSPKLLDFGVAKLLAHDAAADLSMTSAGGPLTPEYASPEQVQGRAVTTATDVYSLGAILYELLTGSKAHRIPSPTPAEVERAICDTAITPPSQMAASPRLRRQLAGDLDNIVQMAMRKEPERRYSSVEQLAADVERHLHGLPVAARPDSIRYRWGKFIRRNRLGLGAAGLSALSLLLGTAMAVSQAQRAETAREVAESQRQAAETARKAAEREHDTAQHQRDAAVNERARAETEALRARTEQQRAERRLTEMLGLANHSLFDVHSQIERLPGATDARRQIVKTTLGYLEELSKDAGNDERLRMAVGAGYLKLAAVQGDPYGASLRDYPAALESFRRAADLIGPHRRAHPADAQAVMAWVDVQLGAGKVLMAQGNSAEALARLKGALADASELARLSPNDIEALLRQPLIFEAISFSFREHDSAEALVWARKGVAAIGRVAARFPQSEAITEQLSEIHTNLATVLSTVGNLTDALLEFERASEARERLAKANPNDVVRRRNLMLAYGHVAAVLGNPFRPNLGDSEGARRYYTKSVEIAEGTAVADPRNRTAQYDVAASLLRLGAVDVPPAGLARSLEELRKAAGILESLSAGAPDDLSLKRDWQLAQEYMGHRLRDLGNLPEAIAAYRRSLQSADELLKARPADRPAHAQAMACSRAIVLSLARQGDREGALKEGLAGIERARAGVSIGSDRDFRVSYVARNLVALASAYRTFARAGRASDWSEARAAAERAVAEMSTVPGIAKIRPFADIVSEAKAIIAEADASQAGPAN